MHLPTLPLSSNPYVYVEGDVSIAPSAAIASGVILRAAPGSKIIIAAGVCIGLGTILHAHGGTLEVEAGANLGAGVLMVGKGKIGANACVGTITTIWNDSIEPWQVVPAGSVVGDKGRQIDDISSVNPLPESSPSSLTVQDALNGQVPSNPMEGTTSPTNADSQTEPQAEEPNLEVGTSVYGQGNLNRLLKTLFPYNNQSLNRPSEDG
jgi:carbon dioxide concentrating mechanism protein CcmN